ncbi:Putative redox protein [Elusimicrobium minutum Pei191]|uniref:Putative redox protein n=1 Tax=Elusimicrobium minutum (strain Pei191) TaxID=445932 RepID=B2KD04_ELUMP|nr:OsmC family protein [Elusimicrobium minutum]ACC98400.1 Putative redox protein [Elusimicrobium minutum Pei191]
MSKIVTTYLGDGEAESFYPEVGEKIFTDLPLDNGGKGRKFSATDIFTASLAACIVTIMGKMAESRGDSLKGAKIEIEKIMESNPRRIGKFIIDIIFPEGISKEKMEMYSKVIHTCPVHNSIHPDIKVEVNIK